MDEPLAKKRRVESKVAVHAVRPHFNRVADGGSDRRHGRGALWHAGRCDRSKTRFYGQGNLVV